MRMVSKIVDHNSSSKDRHYEDEVTQNDDGENLR